MLVIVDCDEVCVCVCVCMNMCIKKFSHFCLFERSFKSDDDGDGER